MNFDFSNTVGVCSRKGWFFSNLCSTKQSTTKVIFLFTNEKIYRNKNWQMSEVKLRTCSNKENEMINFFLYFPLLLFSFSYNLRNVTHTLLDTRTSGVFRFTRYIYFTWHSSERLTKTFSVNLFVLGFETVFTVFPEGCRPRDVRIWCALYHLWAMWLLQTCNSYFGLPFTSEYQL